MHRHLIRSLLPLLLTCAIQPALAESKFSQKQDQPLFTTVSRTDPAFAAAIQKAQASLPVFRALLAEQQKSQSAPTTKMVKKRFIEGDNRVWLWLSVEADTQTGFTTSVFEAPPQFSSLKTGAVHTVLNTEVADWAVIDANGLVHGGYSLRLARSRQPESERAAYDAYIGAKAYAPLPR